jgi:hypothetical protein
VEAEGGELWELRKGPARIVSGSVDVQESQHNNKEARKLCELGKRTGQRRS